mmetsp:Transcript_15127/g.44750  ORF Transcript_15127/g.44750 Transcript_15127/m.44750 type:complete len:299 (+) Transcript_15127:746-1642(+)
MLMVSSTWHLDTRPSRGMRALARGSSLENKPKPLRCSAKMLTSMNLRWNLEARLLDRRKLKDCSKFSSTSAAAILIEGARDTEPFSQTLEASTSTMSLRFLSSTMSAKRCTRIFNSLDLSSRSSCTRSLTSCLNPHFGTGFPGTSRWYLTLPSQVSYSLYLRWCRTAFFGSDPFSFCALVSSGFIIISIAFFSRSHGSSSPRLGRASALLRIGIAACSIARSADGGLWGAAWSEGIRWLEAAERRPPIRISMSRAFICASTWSRPSPVVLVLIISALRRRSSDNCFARSAFSGFSSSA